METQMKKKFREEMDKIGYHNVVNNEWVINILKCHPEWDEKTNKGNRLIVKGYGLNNDFELKIFDETQYVELDRISWVKSIKCHLGYSIRYYDKIKITKLARKLILDQILTFRINNNVPREGFHIDHHGKDFQVIFNEWMSSYLGKDMETITEEDILKNQFNWQQYHITHAKLQALSIEEHKKITRERKRVRQN